MVKIFVGRLLPTVSASQLRELFEKYGSVSDCDVLRDYGFVHMSREADAQRAINALDKSEFCGSRLSVELSTSRSMKSCQLTVKNLPNGITSQDLHKLFKKFGTVTLCRINKSFATVHMRFPSMATNAVRNLSGESYRGNVLSVEFANNTSRPAQDWTQRHNDSNYNNNGDTAQSGFKPESVYPSATNAIKPNWSQQQEHTFDKRVFEHSSSGPEFNFTAASQSNKPSELREGRRLRIKQGLKFLQSPMPWSGTTELYETFLNQLKEMLLEEGLELFREGFPKDAIAQISEAINISNYMKQEGINGHLENQDRLYRERAVLKLNMRDTAGALQDADEALKVSGGTNQQSLRFKARILVDCGRRTDAFKLLMNYQQAYQLDPETTQLFKILRQSMTLAESNSEGVGNNKGAIGDGRNRSTIQQQQQNSFPGQPTVNQSNFNVNQSMWPVENGSGDVNNSFISPFGNFDSRSVAVNDDKLLAPESHFQSFFLPETTTPAAPMSFSHPESFLESMIQRPANNSFLGSQIPPGPASSFPHQSSSLFSSDLPNSSIQQSINSQESSLPLPIGFRRPQSSSFSSSIGSAPWNGSSALGIGNESNVDKNVDEELARAIEDELSTSVSNNLTFSNPDPIWHNSIDHPTKSNTFTGDSDVDKNTPSYSHFSSDPSKGGYTGSVLGPAMLGIQTSIPSVVPKPAPPAKPVSPAEPPQPVVTPPQPTTQEMMDNNDSLSEILRNPLHDTHEFKLGCTECVLRTGSRVIDFRHDDQLVHSCYKNLLLCRRRGNTNWLKIRPRPQPQSKAQLYDGPYYICKDLVSGQDCTYPAVCTFAYNQEEIDVWTLERKGMLNRAWLCKSMDPNFVKNLSLVGLTLCKHRGSFDFLCKVCFQNKPRIISKFNQPSGKCTNTAAPHRGNSDNLQLTHILRETTVRYTEIRGPQQAILCRHAIRFQCTRGSDCHFAHSLVERDVWAIMDKEGLTAADIAAKSNEHIQEHPLPNDDSEAKSLFSTEGNLSEFRWKVKFICSICHKNGQISEPTKDMKYCSARAQHSWTNNKKVMLVNTKRSWVQVRDLPYLKNKSLPVRFELCENYRRQKKCSFSGKCNFAHSQEEMDIWMFLRENQIKDIEELREALIKDKQAKQTKRAASQNTDTATVVPSIETQSAFHCWLCDKECNGKRQWEKHCLSEKHKLRALSDSDGHWKFRKPSGKYKLCERHEKGVCDFSHLPASENSCPFAHSKEELDEWNHRRQYVINRVRKAQDDHLIDAAQDMDVLISQSTQA